MRSPRKMPFSRKKILFSQCRSFLLYMYRKMYHLITNHFSKSLTYFPVITLAEPLNLSVPCARLNAKAKKRIKVKSSSHQRKNSLIKHEFGHRSAAITQVVVSTSETHNELNIQLNEMRDARRSIANWSTIYHKNKFSSMRFHTKNTVREKITV